MPRRADTVLTPAFVALTLSELAYFTAGGALLGVTPFFVTGPLEAGPGGVGLAVGAFSVTTLVARPLAGRWTDRRGRRPLLVAGAAAFAVLVLAHLLVTGLAALVAVRLLLGAAEALYVVAGFAALADLAPPGRAGEALSYNSLALYLGLAAGPVIGQVLLTTGGFDLVWAGVGLLLVVAAALAARVPETRPDPGDAGSAGPLLHRAAIVPGIGLLAGIGAVSGFLAFAGLQAARLGVDAWSVVLAVFGLVVVACRLVFARLPDRVPPLRLAAAALGTSGTALLLVALPSVWSLLTGAALLAVGAAFLTPAAFAAVFARVPAAERGSAAGTTSLFIDLGLGGGPLLFGLVAASGGLGAAFVVGAAGAGLGALVLLRRGSVAAA